VTPEEKRPTILYIEDDPGSQVLVKRMLEYAGYEVMVAGTGLAGINMARQRTPDLILMDINLPDLSGREVTTRLRALDRFQSVPIVALTAQSQVGEREKAIAAGLTGYLTKPIDVDTLPGQVARYLQGQRDEVAPDLLAEAQTAYSREVVERLEAKIREVEKAYNELNRLDKMKDAFIQLTAHELRTPLTLIYGYGRLLYDSPIVAAMIQQSDDVGRLIANLLEAIERMSSVINEILLISRVASGKVELSISVVRVVEIIQGVVAAYQSAIEQRQQQVVVDVEQAPSSMYADPDMLTLALENLLGNAIKYTPDGGTITLRATQHEDRVLITVQDTGIGINPDEQALIFERFYTAGDTQLHSTSKVAFRGGGLGLGLAIAKGIVEAHGGRIWVESAGRNEQTMPGSTFTVSLPLRGRLASPIRQH